MKGYILNVLRNLTQPSYSITTYIVNTLLAVVQAATPLKSHLLLHCKVAESRDLPLTRSEKKKKECKGMKIRKG